MTTHYPHGVAEGNKQGLHYSAFSPLIHRLGFDLQRKIFSLLAKSGANPLRQQAIIT
jgi:hypothetical protein